MITYILIVFLQQIFAYLKHIGQTGGCCQAPTVMFATPYRISATVVDSERQKLDDLQITSLPWHDIFLSMAVFRCGASLLKRTRNAGYQFT